MKLPKRVILVWKRFLVFLLMEVFWPQFIIIFSNVLLENDVEKVLQKIGLKEEMNAFLLPLNGILILEKFGDLGFRKVNKRDWLSQILAFERQVGHDAVEF
ncbi:hypothetical protein IFM89_006805 [Coptis chinensis]|uniref:Uncharacterized protein n=1 Tax=Coptis chinensis TaxID=261450 RepID=A0A835HWC0_9MAGN|nr:hypothetical protein IFM89_006805 [Coptis chinensis]